MDKSWEWKEVVKKIKKRMPGGSLYEDLKQQKKTIINEDNILFKELMLTMYRKNKDIYFKGINNVVISHDLHQYNKLNDILHFEYITQKDAMRIKDLVVPIPEEREKSFFAMELMDVALHYIVGLENINRFCLFQGEGSYENLSYIYVKKGDVVLDCGANMGLYSAVASREGAVVYAFEPSSYIIDKYLHITAEENPNISIVNMALSNKRGETEFIIDETNLAFSRIKDEEGKKTEKVIVTTIDDFVREQKLTRVDFIKADIEGAEREMLRGGKWVLKHFAPKLSICTYHLPDDPQVLERIIKEANPNYIVHHEPLKLYAYCQ